MSRARRGEAREDGEAERAAHHERRVDDARREPRLLRRDVAHGREQHGVERDAGPEAEQDHRRQHVDQHVPVDRRAGEQHQADRREHEAGRERHPDPEAQHELRREPDRERSHDQVGGQEREPDLQRAVPEHELEVEGREEEPREHRRRPEHADDVGRGDVPEPEEAERHERRVTRDSITRKTPRSTAAAPRRPSVWVDVQPASLPLTIA